MKLNHLRDVLAVAEHGSLRAASRVIGVTQPAITRSIREIEHELGAPLFERHARGVRLTHMGQIFARRAETVRSELRHARDEIAQMMGKTIGEVAIAMSTASCMSILPKAVNQFRLQFPDAVLKIDESFFQPIEDHLMSGTIDFFVGPIDPTTISPRFLVEPLLENRRIVVGRRGHGFGSAQNLSDLKEARWVRPTLSPRSTEGDFDLLFKEYGLPPGNIVIHARSALITLLMVANGDFLTIVPESWMGFSPVTWLFETLETICPLPAAPICIVRRLDMPLTPIAEYLCDMVRRVAEQQKARR